LRGGITAEAIQLFHQRYFGSPRPATCFIAFAVAAKGYAPRDDGTTLSILLDCHVSLWLPRKDDAGIGCAGTGRRRCFLVMTMKKSSLRPPQAGSNPVQPFQRRKPVMFYIRLVLLPGRHSLIRLRDDGAALSILLDCRVSLWLPRKDDAGIGRRRCFLVMTMKKSSLRPPQVGSNPVQPFQRRKPVMFYILLVLLPGCHSLIRLCDDGTTLSILLDCHVSLRLPRKDDAGIGCAGTGRRRCFLVMTMKKSSLRPPQAGSNPVQPFQRRKSVMFYILLVLLPGRHSLVRLRDDGAALSILMDCHVSLRLPRKDDAGIG